MDQATNSLRLRLFGGFDLRAGDGRAAAPANRKTRALLACLALSPDRPWPREKLMALLWSDRSEEQARASLRQALAELRRALGEPSPLRSGSDAVSLEPAQLSVDAVEFERLAKGTELAAAAALYRGDLLEGHGVRDRAFDEWLLVERRRLHDLAVQVLARCAESLAGDAGIETALRLLQIDPEREETHRLLMRLYAAAGRRPLALRQYELCRETLERELNIGPDDETQALYRQIRDGTEAAVSPDANGSAPAAALPGDKPSVAVLPFLNIGDDREQQYFSDGITEDIITELSRYRSLHVIARNSSFIFKGKAVKVQEIARELGVAYVVEGSVRKAGDRIRITAQLVEGEGGRHLWAERYDRPAEDVFAIEDEVVRTVAATLAGRIEAAGADGLRRRPTTSLSVYECVLRGAAMPVGDPADEAAARQLFEQAIALDPGYGRAYAHLAISHLELWLDDMSGSDEDLGRAFELAQRAAVLDGDEIVCHTALCLVQLCRRRYEEAEYHASRALALNPNRPNAIAAMADVFLVTGRPDACVSLISDAMRLDPHYPAWYWEHIGAAHFHAQRSAAAIAAIRRRPNLQFDMQAYLAASHAQLDEDAAMRTAAAEVMRLRPDFSVAGFVTHRAFKFAVDDDYLASSLRKAGLPG